MSTTPMLTTTSYAILGLLAVRPHTTYEIAQQMDRALGMFWPRARSKVYEEPKKLAAAGLARAKTEAQGRRTRTSYAITAKGRRTLAAWLAEPSAPPALEAEHLVRVFLSEHGTRDDLLRTLEQVRRWSREETAATGDPPDEYLRGEGPFPERLPWLILVGQLLEDFLTMMESWSTWAIDQVESWPDDLSKAAPDLEALAAQAARVERIREQLGVPAAPGER
jgi:DNA-binding PadR family transcriptional regulator